MDWDPAFLPVTELSQLLRKRALSSVELVDALLGRIEAHDSQLRCYLTVCESEAREAARAADAALAAGRAEGPLHGIPLSVKDISWTRGVRTTAHSRALVEFAPSADATHVARLKQAGMILLGKTNTTEFACGGAELVGFCRNPWDLALYAGGSSSGSAAALAAGLAVAATGSDTGGSIRVPAGFCGVVGVKPTYGRVSRHGVIPLSWSQDHAGPMTRGVADAALMLSAMAGPDPWDPTSSQRPVPDYLASLNQGIEGLVLGIPRQHYYEKLDPEVETAVRAALRQLENLGARLEPVDLPLAGPVAVAGATLIATEGYAAHADRLRTDGALYSDRARRRLSAGAFLAAADHIHAQQLRQLWVRQLAEVFTRVDALITPTLPITAFPVAVQAEGPPDTSWGTRQYNLAGIPAMTLPCGFTTEGLPIALQIACKAFDESTMFRIGHAYEQSTAWHRRHPALNGGSAA